MHNPVYVYYRLENYYQNHRRYVKSRNDAQLRGDVITSFGDLEDCDPIKVFIFTFNKFNLLNAKSVDGSKNPKDFYSPCGLIAWSMFNGNIFFFFFIFYHNFIK